MFKILWSPSVTSSPLNATQVSPLQCSRRAQQWYALLFKPLSMTFLIPLASLSRPGGIALALIPPPFLILSTSSSRPSGTTYSACGSSKSCMPTHCVRMLVARTLRSFPRMRRRSSLATSTSCYLSMRHFCMISSPLWIHRTSVPIDALQRRLALVMSRCITLRSFVRSSATSSTMERGRRLRLYSSVRQRRRPRQVLRDSSRYVRAFRIVLYLLNE